MAHRSPQVTTASHLSSVSSELETQLDADWQPALRHIVLQLEEEEVAGVVVPGQGDRRGDVVADAEQKLPRQLLRLLVPCVGRQDRRGRLSRL